MLASDARPLQKHAAVVERVSSVFWTGPVGLMTTSPAARRFEWPTL
jgi:hypothetical protein